MNLSDKNQYRKIKIANIVFLQGDDYLQYEQDKSNAEENGFWFTDIDYLLQWLNDDFEFYEQNTYRAEDINTTFLGKLTKIKGYKGFWLFSKNTRMGYIGLSKIISFE